MDEKKRGRVWDRGDGGSETGRGSGRGRGTGRGRGRGRGFGRGTHDRAFSPQHQQQMRTELRESPSSSSISSVASQGSKRQAPSHTPTPLPSQPGTSTSVPQEQQRAEGETAEITKEMSDVTVYDSVIPQRKSKGEVVGKEGRPIPLQVNHLALKLKNPKMIVIHYDVSFKPDKPKRLFRLVMKAFQKKVYPEKNPAFDGRKNLYSVGYLPGGDIGQVVHDTVKIFNEERQQDMEFEVTVKYAATVDMTPLIQYMNKGSSTSPPQQALQAIDIVLRSPAALRFVPAGRSFFTAPEDGTVVDLGDGLELWYGFYQSAILGWDKPFLNVDVAHKGFPKRDKLIDVIKNLTGLGNGDLQYELNTGMKSKFQMFIKGLKIEYEIPNQPNSKRTYIVNKVMDSCMKQRFPFEENGETSQITVGEYFQRHKNYRLRYLNMPCIHVGAIQKNIYVPVELCQIAGSQAIVRKLNEKQTRAMVKIATQPAYKRKQKILDAIRMANFNQDKTVKEFGITVDDRFTSVTGRVLHPPALTYKGDEVVPDKGVWRAKPFLDGKALSNWSILNCDARTSDRTLEEFIIRFARIGQDLGCQINNRPTIVGIRRDPAHITRNNLVDKLKQCKERENELVVVIIPDSGLYGKVKQAAELDVGILTQCLKAVTVFKNLSPATVTNILLKVNSKLDGMNHSVRDSQWFSLFKPPVLDRPVMIVGADVTHPSPDQTHIPSVAAVAASHDPKAFQYNMLWRLQPPRTEIINDLENIMKEQLLFFYKKTNLKPERIFFYRDGVGEGQFLQVLNKELQAIRRACKALQADYQPKITFLVVQKRHHTRLFPTRRDDEDGKNKNVPAGTIVDTTITHPTEFDFYLVSHASIQGTSRPTKYHLLWDDNEMDEDDLEALTYYLCHLFSRCTRSVSYPAPTYYAHLAAFRARVYFETGEYINLNNLDLEQSKRKIKDDIVIKSPMFFV